ncbi:hypothetical protein SAMN04488029_0540 [Reichenbachiella faecimaris]|uniref:Outer membrane protein beta-barrel domain-containing protein n=1 Tax=Reichenbachiella faecimaris TaxID=692418 RepID=A0A1W2G776_REIFA|nr:hypothetical protein [Reichenbachiella faecimaris]SMD32198.1 hypothetical protein SAMN04488029_0540 [Reichenbachiella faecimaris]
MKRIGLITLSCAIAIGAHASDLVKEDTVVIEFGERSKMVIYAETQQDLKDLGDYDINAMIGELNANLDSISTDTEEVSIVEESDKYRKDLDESTKPLSYYGDDRYGDSDRDQYERRYDRRDYGSRIDDYDDNDYVIVNKNRTGRRGSGTYGTFEMELGMNNWLENGSFPDNNNAAYAVKPWGSWYVAVGGAYHTRIAGPLKLKWGGNMSWYNWKMENSSVRISKTDAGTTFVEDPTINGKKSKLAATYVNASLMPMLEFDSRGRNRSWNWSKYRNRGFRMGVGMYAGYRIDSWTKIKYSENGENKKDKDKGNYYLNNFRYGVKAQVGFRGMDLFFNYDLNEVFATDKGPELQAISFGFIL